MYRSSLHKACGSAVALQEFGKRRRYRASRESTVYGFVDLDRRCESTAAEACHLLDRKSSCLVRVFVFAYVEMLFERVIDLLGAFHKAGGSYANFYPVTARRFQPELPVKRGNALDNGGRDRCHFADPTERWFREVVEPALNLLEDGNDITAISTY
jgi:hypothetical protein